MNRISSVLATGFITTILCQVACGDSKIDEQVAVQDTQSETPKSAVASESPTTPSELDPLSLVGMVEFSGSEAEGFHDCFWIGPASHNTFTNVAYPDEGAIYWAARFQLPEDASHLEIEGHYPNARYMSYNAYDKATQPTDALLDSEIAPMEGANPFTDEDKSGGKYLVKVIAAEAPRTDRPDNTLYLGSEESRNPQLPMIYRIYVPAADTDYTGGVGLPKVRLVMKDGEKLSGQAMCAALNSPVPGSDGRTIPTVAMKKATFQKLVQGPGIPAGFPASEKIEWLVFWGGRVRISRLLADRNFLEQAIADSEAGTLPKQSGFFANIHNEYISAYINETFGELVVLRGKLPTTSANGWDITSGRYDLRYWSLCANESIVTTSFSDCVYDSDVILDADRNYTIVVSKAANRPANATPECGVTWVDWGERGDGAGDPKQGNLILRNMVGEGFKHSVQTAPSIASAESHMGPYYPVSNYSSKEDFEALGCNAVE